MAGNVDSNFDPNRSLGDQLPTVTIDYVEVSYGTEPVDDDSGELRLSMDPESGTYINGSFSIYFTKESNNETNQQIAEWLIHNLDDLYLYSWASSWKSINKKVKESRLDLQELFTIMEPANHESFTSDHPAYSLVIEEMKDKFLNTNWHGSEHWRTYGTGHYNGSSWEWDHSSVPDHETIVATIDSPGSWAYQRFWGSGGTSGPWRDALTDAAVVDIDGSGEDGLQEIIDAGYSFVSWYLEYTLAALIGTDASTDYSYWGTRFNAIRISDFIQSVDGSNVKIEGLFDKEGDEIGVILNLPINFKYSQDIIKGRMDDDKEVYIIATIGRKVLNDMTWEPYSEDDPGVLKKTFREMNSTLFNSNFGDITYEHILTGEGYDTNSLKIANDPEEVFVSVATGAPIEGMPIMSINGTYHEARPVTQAMIVNTMNQILNKYGEYIDKDIEVKTNIANLARILGEHGDSIDLLRRLQTYRKTYMQKAAGVSGNIYEAFKKLLYRSNQSVIKQSKLKKVMIVNNKIIDARMTAENVSYVAPNGTGNGGDMPGAGTERATAGSYIPQKWHQMTRRSVKTIPIEGTGLLGDLAQYILEEGLPTFTYVDEGGSTTAGSAYGGIYEGLDEADSEDRAYWASYFERYTRNKASGNPTGLLEDEIGEGSFGFATGLGADHTGGDIFLSTFDQYTDTVVENKGIFFFDYEKALQTYSKLSYVISPWKIERYLGLHVPWDYYRVTKVELVRKEMKFLTNMDAEAVGLLDEEYDYINISQTLMFDPDTHYPFAAVSTYSGYIDNMRYGQPYVHLASSGMGGSFSTYGVMDSAVSIGDYATNSQYQTLTDYFVPGTSYDYTDFSDIEEYERGMTTYSSQRSGEFLMDQAASVSAYIEADDVVPTYSYLRFINFDAPLGYRDQNSPGTSYPVPDSSANTPTGRLTNFRSAYSRGGYRVMAFEYRDYMDDDVAYYNTVGREEFDLSLEEEMVHGDWGLSPDGDFGFWTSGLGEEVAHIAAKSSYKVRVHVEDTSLKMVDMVYNIFEDDYNSFIRNYYNLAIATCSFNNINDQFNDFFSSGIKEKYPAYEDRQWIKSPYMFNIARNILFGTFSGADGDTGENREVAAVEQRMRDNAEDVARLIGPDDGRLMHLNRFKTEYEKLLNIIKPRVGSPTTAVTGQRLFGSRTDDHPGGDFTGPVYSYHPVYDRLLDVSDATAGTPESPSPWDTGDAVTTAWQDAIERVDTYVFTGGGPWYIDEPIYGDLFLSALHKWDYTPPIVEVNYDEIYDFIERIPGLLQQHWNSFAGYRGLQEPASWSPIDEGGRLWIAPDHSYTGSGYEEYYKAHVNQAVLFAFIYKFYKTLSDGIGCPRYELFEVGGYGGTNIWNHIKAVAGESARYGSATEAETQLNAGIAVLYTAAILAVNETQRRSRLIPSAKSEMLSSRGIEAIVTRMKPIIYYEIINRGFGDDASWTAGPSYHRPFIEFTTIEWDSDDEEFEERSNYGSDWGVTQRYIRLQASPGYNLGPGIPIYTGMPSDDSLASGFAPVYRRENFSGPSFGDYYEYPGSYSPQDNHSGILGETI